MKKTDLSLLIVLTILISIVLFSPLKVFAQGSSEPPVLFEPVFSLSGIAPGGEITLAALFKVPEDHHITDHSHGLYGFDIKFPDGITVSDTAWPHGEIENEEEVYRGDAAIRYTLRASSEIVPGIHELSFSYYYQICRDIDPKTCYMPNGGEGKLKLIVLDPGATPLPSGHPLFAGAAEATDNIPMKAEAIADQTLEDRLTSALERGSIIAFLLVFVAGILVSFTPCVYPMIPIIIGFVGSSAGGSKTKGFFLSIFFVTGLALTYAILGVVAGATGALFGALLSNPIVLWGIVAIFITLGISMLGAFDIALPASVQGKLMSGQRKGVIGAILMGGVTGIIAAPCAGPPLIVLLGWIGKTGNLVLGFFLMGVFALGIGVLFIFIGTFAGAMTALPQAGAWMDKIKKGLGILIFIVALYYLNMLIPQVLHTIIMGSFILLVGMFLGALAKWDDLSTGGKYWKGIGIIIMLAGSFYILLGLAKMHELPVVTRGSGFVATMTDEKGVIEEHVPWRVNDYDAVMADAAESGKPVLIDFYADWCGVCVELDHKVWNKPDVISASNDYIALKLDFTRSNRELEKLREKHGIAGLPTVLILGSDGTEKSRFSSFKKPEEVTSWLNNYK
ncbi:MAG: cytochrome c biogenesis protein CcdA [Candidatus Electryonea clarkiae]|nr:cytochrome c biogenesis protein CcdA [Candidatus Electryonea clarkiae]MDP8286366.1 cytochrome c biogenesis protein CcdA [Candidatus Electryonea clarkiae]